MNIIKVTERNRTEPTQINMDLVTDFTKNLNGTAIYFIGSERPMLVIESPNEILELLHNEY